MGFEKNKHQKQKAFMRLFILANITKNPGDLRRN